MTLNKQPSLRKTETWTTCQVIDKQYAEQPNKVAIEFVDGACYTYTDIYHQSIEKGSAFLGLGIKPGETLAVMLPSSEAFLECWWGCHRAGIVLAGLNTDLVGQFLAHALNLCEASTIVIDASYVSRIESIFKELLHVKRVIVVGDYSGDSLPIDVIEYISLNKYTQQSEFCSGDFQSLACLMFTSGTTGPSKAVMMPHAHCYLYGLGSIENLHFSSDDVYYVCMPLYHVNALFMQIYAAMICGAKAVIRKRFSASNWLTDINLFQVTHTNLLGVMSEYISNAGIEKQNTSLRVIAAAPAAPSLITLFKDKLNVRMIELYGMSEVNIPLFTPLDAVRPSSCGKAYEDFFDVRIANPKTDLLCNNDEIGEIQVRPKLSAGFMSGYYRMPEQTIEAWKNLWFHTGDAGKMDAQGYVYFIDRIKDCIRRKGENISSYEVETALCELESVTESATIAVPSDIEGGEDEVLAILVCEKAIDMDKLIAHIDTSIPKYARPRYIRFMATEEIPRTSTNKIQKVKLRQQGVTQQTIDLQTR